MRILILGATSSIARACAEVLAARKHHLFLAGRNLEELKRICADLQIRFNVETDYGFFDAVDLASHHDFWQATLNKFQAFDGVLIAVGALGQTPEAEIISVNFTGPVNVLTKVAEYFVKKKSGFIVGLSSVAGDRGRFNNYVYGASKAALTTYLQGLRACLYPHNVQVLTVKLGVVDTKMTFDAPYPKWLKAQPGKVANKIIRALSQQRDTVYIPGFWRFVMLIIRALPERVAKRLKF